MHGLLMKWSYSMKSPYNIVPVNHVFSHSSVWDRLVFGHEFILKNEVIWIKSTIFAKLFGVIAPLSSKVIAQNPGKNNVGDTKIKLNINNEDLMRMFLKLRQLRCSCHLPAPLLSSPRTASLSSRWPGARGLMAGGMCSFLPFISRPGVSLAILAM